jgi:hypothetical protein
MPRHADACEGKVYRLAVTAVLALDGKGSPDALN